MNKDEALARLQRGSHHDPFQYLGRHKLAQGYIVRTFMPQAEKVELIGFGEMQRVEGSDVFKAFLTDDQAENIGVHYQLRWCEKHDHSIHEGYCPYSFSPQVGEIDLHLFGEGKHQQPWKFLGAHLCEIDGVRGCQFAVWAPAVRRVSVVGDFNGWHGLRHPMRNRGQSGIWELFIPGLYAGDQYKYEILGDQEQLLTKADPYGQQMGLRPETCSLVPAPSRWQWMDQDWLEQRNSWQWQHSPVSIYEVHLGSWRLGVDGAFLNYRELARKLIPYLKALHYTHVELLPIMEHPLDESWGYQVSGYYAPTARYGTPDDLRCFVDLCHQNGLGVLLDWVPAHFPRDDFALARFTGKPLYEHEDWRKGEHKDWGTLIFDYGRNEVRNFLVGNALYWIEEFHIDGLRVDAVASMLYLDYSRNEGEWLPNQFGGREHLEAITFIREFNELVHQKFPGVLTIAEESTAWPMVSRPVYMGGLGFTMKWNMGWMNDTLSYFEMDPVHRKFHQDMLTFSQLYAFSENFTLPFSHDEVVHMKRSMLDKMPGDSWQKFANLRLLMAYQMAHPGKKLLFMGSEFGQWHEWNAKSELDWALLDFDSHQGLQKLVGDLNHLYVANAAFHQLDFDPHGFRWIDCNDKENSILSFIRQSRDGQQMVCVFNFTPVPRTGYRIGVPNAHAWKECLNTDSRYYYGSDLGNQGHLQAQAQPWMGFEQSLQLTLPPLAALILCVTD